MITEEEIFRTLTSEFAGGAKMVDFIVHYLTKNKTEYVTTTSTPPAGELLSEHIFHICKNSSKLGLVEYAWNMGTETRTKSFIFTTQ